jgi:glycosyltransferase involved in cell wall biosynthesis
MTYDLSPPWDNGLKVYGRGLMNSLQRINGMELTTLSKVEDISKHVDRDYEFIHVVLTGRDPFTKALRYFRNATIFKHIVTPSIGFKNAFSTNLCYSMINRFETRLVKCFSSKFVAESYFLNGSFIVPPSVDTATFHNTGATNEEIIMTMLGNSTAKAGIDNIKRRRQGIILYSGPLTKDRFPYEKVLSDLKETKSNLLIIGRPTNNGAESSSVEEIMAYTKRMNLESSVSIAVKLLTEEEKISLLNFADVVIQPFAKRTQSYVAVDPPIFLLEAMSCGKPVITSRSYSFQSFIKNGYNGYTIDWEDANEFREALSECLEKGSIGSNARKTVLENFCHDSVAKKVQGMYNDYN